MKLFFSLSTICLLLIPLFSAQSEEANAADRFYDPILMAEARQQLINANGGQANYLLIAERLEYQSNEGESATLGEIQGWFGSDSNRLWLKNEFEYAHAQDTLEELELQVLFSKPISVFFDAQIGVRHDNKPSPNRSFGVIGVQGLAPYWFEIDLASFISEDGDVSFRTEFESDLLISQRLILQPRMELNFAVQDVPEYAIGSGLSDMELGLRLRYEIIREVAPYIGVSWSQLIGGSRGLARLEGDEISIVSFVAGLRLWF